MEKDHSLYLSIVFLLIKATIIGLAPKAKDSTAITPKQKKQHSTV